ncbi:MAG: hypothetical protein ACN4GR_09675 [Arenicellales bacterium]
MSDETNKPSAEADGSDDKLKQSTSFNVEIQAEKKADAAEEKKEVERPGSCCGACSWQGYSGNSISI